MTKRSIPTTTDPDGEGLKLHLSLGPLDIWAASKAAEALNVRRDEPGLKLHLVPCNAMAAGNLVAEDRGLIEAHRGAQQSTGAAAGLTLRLLVSYHYYRDTDFDKQLPKYFNEPYPEMFADSGAFSAMTQGADVDVHEYAAWVKRWKHYFTAYSNLDVIRDPVGTARNQAILEDQHGLSPLPVFHGGSPYSELERLIEQYPYIALGGLVGKSAVYMPHLIRCFKLARGRSVFHGFGVTSWRALKSLPWYSVDSSSWGQGFRYGMVPIFDERMGTFHKVNLGDKAAWTKYRMLVRGMGFDPADFADRKRNDRAKICALSAIGYMRAERWLRARHGTIRIPDRPESPEGLNLHLVVAGDRGNDTRPLSRGLRRPSRRINQ
jgi:hypothetical protein